MTLHIGYKFIRVSFYINITFIVLRVSINGVQVNRWINKRIIKYEAKKGGEICGEHGIFDIIVVKKERAPSIQVAQFGKLGNWRKRQLDFATAFQRDVFPRMTHRSLPFHIYAKLRENWSTLVCGTRVLQTRNLPFVQLTISRIHRNLTANNVLVKNSNITANNFLQSTFLCDTFTRASTKRTSTL